MEMPSGAKERRVKKKNDSIFFVRKGIIFYRSRKERRNLVPAILEQ